MTEQKRRHVPPFLLSGRGRCCFFTNKQKISGGIFLHEKEKKAMSHVLAGIAVRREEGRDLPWDERFFLSDRLVRHFLANMIKRCSGVSEFLVIFH